LKKHLTAKPKAKLMGIIIILLLILIGGFYLIYLCDIAIKEQTQKLNEMKSTLVSVRHDVSGCCDSNGRYSEFLGGRGSGIIFKKENDTVFVLTARHVVDCVYAKRCIYPISEMITITTYDGKSYKVTQVLYAPRLLDLAILTFDTNETNFTLAKINYHENRTVNDRIICLSYPVRDVIGGPLSQKLVVLQGRITDISEMVTMQGMPYLELKTNIFKEGPGASGGGLFNENGELIGIITLKEKGIVAIDLNILSYIYEHYHENNNFYRCPPGSYKNLGKGCCPYGTKSEITNQGELHCLHPCGLPTTLCPYPQVCCNDNCYMPCPEGYAFDTNCTCSPVSNGENTT